MRSTCCFSIFRVSADSLSFIAARFRPMASLFGAFQNWRARALRDVLIGDKPIDIDAIPRVEVLTEGPLHNTLRDVGIECETVAAVPMRGSDKESASCGCSKTVEPSGPENSIARS